MNPEDRITVLIVDDHPVVCEGFRLLLEAAGNTQVVAEARNAQQGYEAYTRHRPHVVVMDLTLPDQSGLDAIRRILQRDPEARILVFSIHENPVLIKRARETGVKGYLTKRSAPQHMREAVCAIAAGGEYFDPELAENTEGAANPADVLSQREFEVFLLLAKGKSVNRIAEILHVSNKTVGVHYTRIMRKLKAESTAFLARLAIRHELIQP